MIVDAPDDATTAARSTRPRWRRRLPIIVLVGVIISGSVAGVGYWRWRTHAEYLFGYYDIGVISNSWTVGRAEYFGAEIQPKAPPTGHRSLELREIVPRVTVNTADATVEVLTCRVGDQGGVGAVATLSMCASTGRFTPATYDLGHPATEIVYKVTPTRHGLVRIEGSDVSFCGSGRCGGQHAGTGILMHVTRNANTR